MKIEWSNRAHFFTKKELKYLNNFLEKSKNLTQGNELSKFENGLKKYLKVKNVYALSSAAAALEIIALLLNLKKGDEVIIPSHTYCASAIPFARNKAKIIWADIDVKTKTINLLDVKKKITKNTKAIVLVHLYGFSVDVNSFKKEIKNKKIKIIEDCAQAFGANVNGKKTGTIGDFACFSFHAQKNLTTLGEGGALFVKDNRLAKHVKGLRHNGHESFNFYKKDYWKPAMTNVVENLNNHWPYKFTLSEIQAAAGHLMLKRIDQLNNERILRAKKFVHEIKKISNKVKFVEFFKHKRHVYHLLSAYVVPSKKFNRDKLIRLLYEKYNIKCAVQYYPLYKYDLFKKKKFGIKMINKNTEEFYNNMISFPFHVWMSGKEFNYLISSCIKAIRELDN
jgi:perosamine synthetase